MTGQSNDAAERSAHVLRGGADPAPEGLPSIIEWKDEKGQLVGAARGVVELRAENAKLRALLARTLPCIENAMVMAETRRQEIPIEELKWEIGSALEAPHA